MMAKCARCSGLHSMLAPASSSTKSLSGVGNDGGDAAAGPRPAMRPQLEGGRGEDAPGVAQRNHRIGLAFVDQFDRADDGAILLLAHGRRPACPPWSALRWHGPPGRDGRGSRAGGRAAWISAWLPTRKSAVISLVGLQGPLDAFDDDPAAVVATHDIHCDAHKMERAAGPPARAAEPNQAPAVTVSTWRPL